MAPRLFICIVLATLAGLALVLLTVQSAEVKASEVVAGFAIEAIGILVTVGFVDLLLERERNHEKVKMLVWNLIHDIDHAVWVWQGGSRRLNLGELVMLIDLIDDKDPRPIPTENLLLQIGDACQNILQMEDPATRRSSSFEAGLAALAPLSYFRDPPNSPMANNELQRCLREGVNKLLAAVKVSVDPSSMPNVRNVQNTRDTSADMQSLRLTGIRTT